MTEVPYNTVVEEFLSSNRSDISKDGIVAEGQDSTILSDSLTFLSDYNLHDHNSLNDLDLTLGQYDPEFTNLIDSDLFNQLVNEDNGRINRRFSWPCVYSDDYDLYLDSNNCNNALTDRRETKARTTLSRFRSLDGVKSFSILRRNTWGSLMYRFRKFCIEHNRNNLVGKSRGSSLDSNSSLSGSSDLNTKSLENILNLKNDVVQYAIFKPANLNINNREFMNGFVKNKEEKDDIVTVVKSLSNKRVSTYGLTRIIKCTSRQEYEVLDHNTGNYFLLKLTNNLNTFNIYKTLFDNPHPNFVEVIQLLTNSDFNSTNDNQSPQNQDSIYYILLNTCNHMRLSDYHINTLPSLIDFKVLRNIIKGLLNFVLYLHSRSLVLSKLSMKSVILCNSSSNGLENGINGDVRPKVLDLEDVRECEGKNDIKHDLWIIGNLLFNFIEGKQSDENYSFKSNLWTLCPKMFDFCIIALGKRSSFNSALEALIHPWFTS
uniref:Protein kinase domain-containing protein n=1 Tax=Theileria annulata TaxID=5874 RepID=A0A3B0N876_THEAN